MGSSRRIRLRKGSTGPLHQRGAFAFVAIALLLVVVAVAIRYLLGASQSTTYGTTAVSQSVQALTVAESGLERARAIIKAGVEFGVDPEACSGADTTTKYFTGTFEPVELGGGSFTYAPFAGLPPGCNDVNPLCTGCKVEVVGTMGAASRKITSEVAYFVRNGTEGFGHTIVLKQRTTLTDSVVISNVAYRAKDKGTGGGNAQSVDCEEDPSSGTTCKHNQWAVKGQGTYNVSSSGVYATLAIPGVYTLTTTLNVDRYYVAVGAIFPPLTSNVTIVGTYASDTGDNKTVGTSNSLDGSTRNDWCPSTSDTLVFGFSSESKVAGTQTRLTGVRFGTQWSTPLALMPLAFLSGSADPLYSEIWYVNVPKDKKGPNGQLGINGYFSTDANKGTTFSVFGPTPGDDWAAGFICMEGVDPSKIRTIDTVTLNPTVWYEPF